MIFYTQVCKMSDNETRRYLKSALEAMYRENTNKQFECGYCNKLVKLAELGEHTYVCVFGIPRK